MPAPANDTFASAIALSTTLPGSRTNDVTTDATKETGEPNDGNYGETNWQSVWYTFTPTSTGRYRFRIKNVTATGAGAIQYGIAIFTGSAVNALTYVGAAYAAHPWDSSTPSVAIERDLTSGVTYRIQISTPGTANAHSMEFDLVWETAATGSAPAGDNSGSPVNFGLDPADVDADYTLVGATVEAWELTGGFADASVWFRVELGTEAAVGVTATVTQTGTVESFFPIIEWYSANAEPVDAIGDLNFLGFEADTDYDGVATLGPDTWGDHKKMYLRVSSGTNYAGSVTDAFHLEITGLPGALPGSPPANNDLASVLHASNIHTWNADYKLNKAPWGNAFINTQAMKYVGTTVDATAEASEPTHGGFTATRSVWHIMRAHFESSGTYKIWVESAVDCVLSVYNYNPSLPGIGSLVSIGEDDDSGAGNWPELNLSLTASAFYWICVDSKTAGAYTLKVQKQPVGTAPSNDNFASAPAFTKPFVTAGTTVGGSGEPGEYASQWQDTGPTDGVWYKYTPNYTGTAIIRGKCKTVLNDGYVFCHVFTGSAVDALTLVSTNSENGVGGEFFQGANPDKDSILYFPVTSGTPYYIRVATFSGGSEDFEIYVDTQQVYLDLQISSTEEMHGTLIDAATVYLDLTCSSVEDYHVAFATDAATIGLRLTPISTYESSGHLTIDSATVYLDISVLGGECYSRFHFVGEGEADPRWEADSILTRWSGSADPRWSAVVTTQPGCH